VSTGGSLGGVSLLEARRWVVYAPAMAWLESIAGVLFSRDELNLSPTASNAAGGLGVARTDRGANGLSRLPTPQHC